jgi:hypothetical protein
VLLALAAVVVAIWLFLRRANELCAIRVTSGTSELVRGRAPARFLSDVGDIVERARLDRATVRVVSESGSPRLVANDDLPDAVAQQLRNAAGQHTVAQFRTGKRAR